MATIQELMLRAQLLKQETALDSISPERAGGIMYDTLAYINQMQLQGANPLLISKIYASVAAMEADTAPVSDLTGQALRPGQVVVIASADSDNGSVYRYNGGTESRWTVVGKIGNLTPVDSLDSDSTQLPLAAHQGKVLGQEIYGESGDLLSEATNTGYIKATDGSIASDANWRYSNLIPYSGGGMLGTIYGHTAVRSFEFYDIDRQIISYYVAASIAMMDVSEVSIPANTRYIRFCYQSSYTYHEQSLSWPIGGLKNKVDEIDSTLMEHPNEHIDDATNVGYITTTGGITSDNNWRYSGLIRCASSNLYGVLVGNPLIRSLEFYNKNQSLIGYFIDNYGGEHRFDVADIEIPDGTYYIRFTKKNGDGQSIVWADDGVWVALAELKEESATQDELYGSLSSRLALATNPGYVSNNGSIVADNTWAYSDIIQINGSMSGLLVGHSSVRTFEFYDINKQLISYYVHPTNNQLFNVSSVTIPDGTAFIRFVSYLNRVSDESLIFRYGGIVSRLTNVESKVSIISPSMLDPEFVSRCHLNLTNSSKIILYGDSISSMDYPWYKDELEALTEASVYNGGFSGYNTATLAGATCLQRIFDYGPDVIIILVGGNDIGASVGTFGKIPGQNVVQEISISGDYNGTYFIQAVDYIVRKVNAYYYDIIDRAGATIPVNMYGDISAIDALKKPKIILCTTLPEKRSGGDQTWNLEANWINKRNACVEVANKNKICCIDTYNLCGIDWSQEPEWVSPTDKNNSYGIYTMDGLHPNKWGYEKIARLVASYLL